MMEQSQHGMMEQSQHGMMEQSQHGMAFNPAMEQQGLAHPPPDCAMMEQHDMGFAQPMEQHDMAFAPQTSAMDVDFSDLSQTAAIGPSDSLRGDTAANPSTSSPWQPAGSYFPSSLPGPVDCDVQQPLQPSGSYCPMDTDAGALALSALTHAGQQQMGDCPMMGNQAGQQQMGGPSVMGDHAGQQMGGHAMMGGPCDHGGGPCDPGHLVLPHGGQFSAMLPMMPPAGGSKMRLQIQVTARGGGELPEGVTIWDYQRAFLWLGAASGLGARALPGSIHHHQSCSCSDLYSGHLLSSLPHLPSQALSRADPYSHTPTLAPLPPSLPSPR